eukprot:4415992-Pleurochrysis_carterae.AAC.2
MHGNHASTSRELEKLGRTPSMPQPSLCPPKQTPRAILRTFYAHSRRVALFASDFRYGRENGLFTFDEIEV